MALTLTSSLSCSMCLGRSYSGQLSQMVSQGDEWLLVDGDDTLWDTQGLYDAVKVGFEKIVCGELLDWSDAVRVLDELDAARVAEMGYTLERFRLSLMDAYRALCSSSGQKPTPGTLQELEALCQNVLKQKPKMLPGARRTLSRLRTLFGIALVTKGDQKRQAQLISSLRLKRYFDRIYIFDRPHEKEYQVVLRDLGVRSDNAWVIGNSPRSDINPALRLGLKCIWFVGRSWLFETEEIVSTTVPIAKSWSDVERILMERG
jgi:putative hydrolase of the HAD superfamily